MKEKSGMRAVALLLSVLMIFHGIGGLQVEAKAPAAPKKIFLEEKSKTLYVGQKDKIEIQKFTPTNASKKVTYQSSNKRIVTVNTKGILKANSAGTATVTVTSKVNSKVKAKCKITVKKTPTKIILKENKKNLKVGETFRVSIKTVKPDKAYSKFNYKTSNASVATVSSKGVVKAKKSGTAVITVNSPVGKKPSATCKITVEEESAADEPVVSKEPVEPTATEKPAEPTTAGQQIEPTDIKLNKTEITLDYGMSTTLRATILPEEAADTTITWKSSNPEVASVADGAVFGVSEGEAVITATTVNGLPASCKVHVNAPTSSVIPADSVSFSETEATINARCWLGLVITINPATAEHQPIVVSSSNANVASAVDQGYNEKGEHIIGVVGGFPGVTYVTARVGGKTVTCKITVVEPAREPKYVVPYIATRYFNSMPTMNEDVVIPYYMTDSEQSEYVKGTTDGKLNLIYEVDNEVKVQENLSLGEQELNLGKLPAGEHSIGIQAEDPNTGKRSHRVYVNIKVEEDSQNTYEVAETELSGVSTATEMTDKLNLLFVQKSEEGYRKVVLPKDGSYTIDGTSGGLKIPSGLTVDLNGSTIKLAVSTGADAAIVTMDNVTDAHITGGTLIGDRGESGALGAVAVRIKGSKYCTVSNMKIKNLSGNAYVTERVESKFSRQLGDNEFKRKISDFDKVSTLTTTAMVDLTELKKESDYLMIGCNDYQKVVRAEFGEIYISFYDSNKKLITTVEGYQHRKTKIPENAQYADAEFLGGLEGIDRIRFYYNGLGENLEVKNVEFDNISGSAIVLTTFNHLLVEGCTFSNIGGRVAYISEGGGLGAGGGWTEAQDLYYRNNTVVGGYKDVYFHTGRNLYLENLKGHNITFDKGVLGGTIRDMDDTGMNIKWTFATYYVSGFGRVFDNNCRNINVKHIPQDKVYQKLPEYRIKNCTIAGDGFNSQLEYIEYVNCTFTNFAGDVGVLRGCTLNERANIGNDIIIYSK